MSNELYHWESDKNFKYYAKIKKGKNTRYFYTRAEWLAYMNGGKTTTSKNTQTVTPKTGVTSTGLSLSKKTTKQPTSKSIKTFGDLVNSGKKLLTSLFKSTANVDKKNSEYKAAKAAISKTVTNAVNTGINYVNSVVKQTSKPVESSITQTQAEKGKDYIADKANENLGFMLLIPTDMIKDAIDFVKDIFTPNKKDEKKEEKTESTIHETVLEENVIEENIIEENKIYEDKIPEDILEEEELEENVLPEWAKDLQLKDREYSPGEDQALINPNYDPYDEDYSMNCTYCTAAYDLRQRGYDVEAMPNPNGADLAEVTTWYENTQEDDWRMTASTKNAGKYLEKMPDGSYGQFCVYWSSLVGGGGHSVVWERNNGQTTIRDCQTNETYSYDDWNSSYGWLVSDVFMLRTDDRKPSEKILKTVRNREE